MIAREHTQCMLDWWNRAGISRADLAVRRPDGAMMWHHDLPLARLPFSWARAANVRGSDIYIRPARDHAWPVAFLDDVTPAMARRIARKYRTLTIQTSPAGGCHLWIMCSRSLSVSERAEAQRWLAARCGADRASTSGEHLGRLAGFKNWKRGGCWVNVIGGFSGRLSWNPSVALQPCVPEPGHGDQEITQRVIARVEHEMTHRVIARIGPDTSESGREWGWLCGRLEAGDDPARLLSQLRDRARARRGSDADRYARHTISKALRTIITTARLLPAGPPIL